MPSYRSNFTLYSRKLSRRGRVWYYRVYTIDGIRSSGKSTGCISKVEAKNYCENLLKRGLLSTSATRTFGEYSFGWFDEGSPWLIDKLACGTEGNRAISSDYLRILRINYRVHILPYWCNIKLEDVRLSRVKLFRAHLLKKELSPKTVNNIVNTLKIIIDGAIADGYILLDPFRTFKPLKTNPNKKDAFKLLEVKKILHLIDDKEFFAFVLLAACTGMRAGEVLAVRKETILDNCLNVFDQRQRKYELHVVKTKEARYVPIIPELRKLLLQTVKNDEFCFQYDYQWYRTRFAKISDCIKDKKNRCLSIHSLRHFFNTYLLSKNVTGEKTAAVLGHSTGMGSMQERYTNWTPEMMPEVYEAQRELFYQLYEQAHDIVS